MAITRIKNNQITDASISNAKIVPGTITGGSLAASLNYAGNLTVTGNLSVSGTTTVVDTVNTTIADPLLVLSKNATGTASVDAGFIVERGDDTNVAFVWDESATEFVMVSTSETGSTAGAIAISAYANVKVNTVKADTISNQAGTASPKIAGLTASRVTFGGTNGILTDDAGFTFASNTLSVGSVDIGGTTVETISGNLTLAAAGGGITTSDDVTITSATTSTSNSTGALVVTGGIGTNENLNVGGDADIVGNLTVGGDFDVTGDLSATNLTLSGDIDAATGSIATLDGVDASFTGNISAGGTASVTGNLTAGNVSTTTAVITTGNITTVNATTLNGTSAALSAGLTVGTTAAVTGNLTAGNVSTTTAVITTGNITTVNATTLNGTSAALSGALTVGTTAAVTGNLTAGNISATTGVLTTGNITTVNATDVNSTDIDATGDLTVGGDVTVTGDVSATDGIFSGDVFVSGNLTVDGTATYVNTVTTTVADPIMLIGGGDDGAAPTTDDNKDRGVGFQWHNGTTAKSGFFGFDDSTGRFTFVPEATITGEVVSGTKGDLDVNEIFAVDGTFSGDIDALTGTIATLDGTDAAFTGNITAGGTAGITGTLTAGNLVTAGDIDAATGTIATLDGTDASFTGNISAGGDIDATGDMSAANAVFSGDIDALTGTIATLDGTDASFTGNVSAGGDIDATGDMSAVNAVFSGDVDALTGTITTLDGVDASFTGNVTAGDVDATTGTITTLDGTTATFTTGNVTTVNAGTVNVSTLANITASTASTTTTSGALILAGGAGISGNINVGGTKSTFTNSTVSTSKTTGAVVVTGGVGISGSLFVGNLSVDANTIGSSNTNGDINFAPNGTGSIVLNSTGGANDTVIQGDTDTNLFYVDAAGDNIGIGTNSPAQYAKLHIESTDSMVLPVGTTAERPVVTVEGMFRYNSDTSSIEYYNDAEWKSVSSDFTVISSEQSDGDGSTVAFVLTEEQTTASCIVSINGVVQLPGTAYSVSGTTLTFTEAPADGDKIEVRKITTTATVVNIADSVYGYSAVFAVPAGVELYAGSASRTKFVTLDNNGQLNLLATTASTSTTTGALVVDGGVGIAGNLFVGGNITAVGDITFGDAGTDTVTFTAAIDSDVIPVTDNTYDLGSASKKWATINAVDAALTGNITVTGSVTATGGFVGLDATQIADGTSNMAVASTNGDIVATVGGATIATVSGAGVTLSSGAFVGALTGNADTATLAADATKLATTRAIQVSGAVTGTADFDGSSAINIVTTATADPTITLAGDLTGSVTLTNLASGTLTATIAANSVALGTDTTGNYVGTGATSGNGISGSVASEGGTFTVTSNATSANTANTIVYRDASGNFSAGTITATVTQAQYADLAENYVGDAAIEPGTVVEFGGDAEVTACAHDMCTRVAGVVSTNPAYLMNSGLEAEHVVAVAFTGRVPCKVVGPVRKGDMMVSAGNGAARAEAEPKVGSIIGKALENFDGAEGVIEVVVGRY